MKKSLVLAFCLVLLSGVSAWAGEWNIDPYHSQVRFRIKHILTWIDGGFDRFGGTISFDPENLAQSRIRVIIPTHSVNTGIEQRDNHLRTADFFEVMKYPVMTFESDRIVSAGGDRYEAHGRLTIKDVTREIVLPFTLFGFKDDPNPEVKCGRVAGIEAHYALKVLDFHVSDGKFVKMGMMGEEVQISLYMEALQKKPDCKE